MNAPARFVIDMDAEHPACASIRAFCSPADELEMAARVDLASLRDQASVGMTRGTDGAAGILTEVCRIATASVFAPVPTSRLLRIGATLRFAIEAARHVDRLERDG